MIAFSPLLWSRMMAAAPVAVVVENTCAASIPSFVHIARARIRIDDRREFHRKTGTLQLAIHPRMIAAKDAGAHHRYAHRLVAG